MAKKIDLNKPRYDQSTYMGRLKHFFAITNPLNLLASQDQLEEAEEVVKNYKKTGQMPPGYNEEKLWKAKNLYDSAFHPYTGEKMVLIGRMGAQVPVNTLITGCLLAYYKRTKITLFWHWVNQSFVAFVNYTNRHGHADVSPLNKCSSYVCGTAAAMAITVYLNNLTKNMFVLLGRLVPFVAVSGATCMSVPLMRKKELSQGIPIYAPDTRQQLGQSKAAALHGIQMVVINRIIMTVPSMMLVPIATTILYYKSFYCRNPEFYLMSQFVLVAFCLTYATPFACALFEQEAEIPIAGLEHELKLSSSACIYPPPDICLTQVVPTHMYVCFPHPTICRRLHMNPPSWGHQTPRFEVHNPESPHPLSRPTTTVVRNSKSDGNWGLFIVSALRLGGLPIVTSLGVQVGDSRGESSRTDDTAARNQSMLLGYGRLIALVWRLANRIFAQPMGNR